MNRQEGEGSAVVCKSPILYDKVNSDVEEFVDAKKNSVFSNDVHYTSIECMFIRRV